MNPEINFKYVVPMAKSMDISQKTEMEGKISRYVFSYAPILRKTWFNKGKIRHKFYKRKWVCMDVLCPALSTTGKTIDDAFKKMLRNVE